MKPRVRLSSLVIVVAAGLFGLSLLQAQDQPVMFDEGVERAAINRVLVQYTSGLDTLDADLYANAFAEDGRFIVGDTVNSGHDAIRNIITDLQESRRERAQQASEEGEEYIEPVMHHVMSNAFIEFVDDTTAIHQSYWMTVIGNDREFRVASMGRYEDILKKIDGEWKISERYLLR